jgi:hypothetical protein
LSGPLFLSNAFYCFLPTAFCCGRHKRRST